MDGSAGRAGLLALFIAAGFAAYAQAMDGSFLSDDEHYVQKNTYIQELTPGNLIEILNPWGVVPRIVENYAPVHLLLHAVAWQMFGEDVRGHHAVNVVFHALASWLLVLLFRRVGIGVVPALLAGAIFLLHPANVEAVAWISQLKSSSALVLSLGALLLYTTRPGWATLLFALALLAKPPAVFAIPVAFLMSWVRSESAQTPARYGWLLGWVGVFAAFAWVEFGAFSDTAGNAPQIYPDPWVQARSAVAIGLRYLVMATTGFGISAFHEPAPVTSNADPWFLAALVVLALLAIRLFVTLRARRMEVVFWVWAAASFAPISNVIPLPFPLADRYLYFILPGLLGALILMGTTFLPRLGASRRGVEIALLVGSVALLTSFGWRSYERARIWRTPSLVMADAERNYPEGTAANTRAAKRWAQAGDVDRTVAHLRAAYARGYNRIDHLIQEPAYAPMRGDPRFQALLVEIATDLLTFLSQREEPAQQELLVMALARHIRGETPEAIELLERALALGGPRTETVQQNLDELRRVERMRARVRGDSR